MILSNCKNDMWKTLTKHKIRLAVAFFAVPILMNLYLSIDNYRIHTVPINKFFFLQSNQHYTPFVKFSSNQPLRESMLKSKTYTNQYCDSCSMLDFPIHKVITVERTIQYADVIP